MTNKEVVEQIREYLSALPADVCEEVEADVYNCVGWPEAPAPLREATGFRWFPQVVQFWFGSVKSPDMVVVTESEDEDGPSTTHEQVLPSFTEVVSGPVSHLVLVHECGNPRCANPAHLINPAVEPERAAAAIKAHSKEVEWVGHGAVSATQQVKPSKLERKASKADAVPAGGPVDLVELVQRCKDDGSHENRTALFNATYRTFYNATRWRAQASADGQADLADEAAQEAMLRLWQKIVEGDLPDAAQAYPLWVSTLLNHGAANYLRSERGQDRPLGKRMLCEADLDSSPASSNVDIGGVLSDWTPPLEQAQFDAGLYFPSPEDELIESELAAEVAALVAKQPEAVQQLFRDVFLDSVSVADFAKSIGASRASAFRWARKLEKEIREVVTGEETQEVERMEMPEPYRGHDSPLNEQRERIRAKFRAQELRQARVKEAQEFAERGEDWTIEKSRVRNDKQG